MRAGQDADAARLGRERPPGLFQHADSTESYKLGRMLITKFCQTAQPDKNPLTGAGAEMILDRLIHSERIDEVTEMLVPFVYAAVDKEWEDGEYEH